MSVTTEHRQTYSEAQRMELRSYVQLAGEVVAHYWPMRTFIHHNPLHGLEVFPFERAAKRGAELFGGRAYLANKQFRAYYRAGRIKIHDVAAAIHRLTVDKRVVFGGRSCSHQDVLQASLVHGVTEAHAGEVEAKSQADRAITESLHAWLRATLDVQAAVRSQDETAPTGLLEPVGVMLSHWSDRLLGTTLVEMINRELVKWCGVFLDEGETAWRMPLREQTFYRSWKAMARYDVTLRLLGIKEAGQKIATLPDRPEESVLESLAKLKIAKDDWEQYLTLHLTALPGWTGYIKWRASEHDHPWQRRYPIDLVKYLAVRLFYERELVDRYCRDELGIAGNREEMQGYVKGHPYGAWLRRRWIEGRLPASIAAEARRVIPLGKQADHGAVESLGRRVHRDILMQDAEAEIKGHAGRLLRLADALSIDRGAIETTAPSDLRTIVNWLDGFPPSHHGSVWLEAFEAGFHRQVVTDVAASLRQARDARHDTEHDGASRPFAQVVFCIDVRSEIMRRHLEHQGGYETLGLAGFFGVPLDYQPFGAHHYHVAHCPVLLKPKNQVREVPRSYHGAVAERHKIFLQIRHAVEAILHDLKENVVTPYVMVEAIGWLFAAPFFGKTLFPRWYHGLARWLKTLFIPPLATALTVDKIRREEAEEMVAGEQHAAIRELLRERFTLHGVMLTPALLEGIRKKALAMGDSSTGDLPQSLRLSAGEEAEVLRSLRDDHGISPRGMSARLERITQMGFSTAEQAYYVEAALRLMGLTANFARVVLFCAHGSTSQNNPYESALDCGACGGNQGLPNARVIATMANKTSVRELLKARGLLVPADTHFCAAQHDTTTDTVRLVDLEDVPATHRKDLQRLMEDVRAAGMHAAQERDAALETVLPHEAETAAAHARAQRRRDDWSQVRPEWGLSKNGLLVVGRRELTRSVNLQGRSFLHSYDSRQDPTGKLLESIMTAPLVVAQWINMEHYFSTVDNEVYGSGSKVYHNVVGRVGVMSGVASDLRLGLPAQTVLNGAVPYHEPMRLLAIIEAPRDRIRAIIDRHPSLEQLFDLGWVALIALDPETGAFHRYGADLGWIPVEEERGDHDRLDAASDERN